MEKKEKEEKKEEIRIDLRSEEFQDVLGQIPHWIIRWGITLIAAITVLVLIGSVIFKYPDVITATVRLTGTRPAATIVAKSTGKIQAIYVKDNEEVEEGAYLAMIENAARMEDVLYVKNFLKKQIAWEADSLSLPDKDKALGTFQSLYSSYYMALAEYAQFRNLNYYRTKVQLMRQRIELNEHYCRSMAEQEPLVRQQLAIDHKQYQRDSTLYKRGLISAETLENTYKQYLQSQLSYKHISTGLENMQIELVQLRESLYDTEYQYTDKKNELELQLKSLTMQLQTEIRNWEMAYILKAPIKGKITFTNYWTENQNITSGEQAFSIVPDETGVLFGKALLPSERSGKVKKGQKVLIRFSNFPDTEFGVVSGIVSNISLISVEVDQVRNYVIEISLPDGLRTNYGKDLPFIPEMEGQADIVTEDLSLLERFILPIKKVINERI